MKRVSCRLEGTDSPRVPLDASPRRSEITEMMTLWTENQTKHMEIHRAHLRGNPVQNYFQVQVMRWPEHRAAYDVITCSWQDCSGPISESECNPAIFHGVPEGPEKVELSPNSSPPAMATK